jgi:DNA-binding response OmpR family regulator
MSTRGLKARERAKREPKAILVVDDEPGIVEVLLVVLADKKFRVLGASHGEDALVKLRQFTPDLVLLDLEMAVLDGAETLRAIRSTARLANVCVIMMSGLPESMVKRRCRGHDAFLRKPFTLEELLLTVSRVLASGPARKAVSSNVARAAPRRKA